MFSRVGTGLSISGNFSSSGFIISSRAINPRLRRLDHQAIAVTVHDRFIARQLELHGNTDRLVAAIAEQTHVLPF
jgi:hypothetical protein